jgi:hypothetical protein
VSQTRFTIPADHAPQSWSHSVDWLAAQVDQVTPHLLKVFKESFI